MPIPRRVARAAPSTTAAHGRFRSLQSGEQTRRSNALQLADHALVHYRVIRQALWRSLPLEARTGSAPLCGSHDPARQMTTDGRVVAPGELDSRSGRGPRPQLGTPMSAARHKLDWRLSDEFVDLVDLPQGERPPVHRVGRNEPRLDRSLICDERLDRLDREDEELIHPSNSALCADHRVLPDCHGDQVAERGREVAARSRDEHRTCRQPIESGEAFGPRGTSYGSHKGSRTRRVASIQIAERGGFEPPNEVNPRYAISSRARSTAPAPLRWSWG